MKLKLRKLSNLMGQANRVTVAEHLERNAELYKETAKNAASKADHDEFMLVSLTLQAVCNFMEPELFKEPEIHLPPKKRKREKRYWLETRERFGSKYVLQRWRDSSGRKRSKMVGIAQIKSLQEE